jgi:sec-independent protein translocase protein TatA
MGEIVVIVVLVLIFFGPSKLPQLGDALGKGIRSFKQASSGADERPARAAEREVAVLAAAKPPAPAATEPTDAEATPPAGAGKTGQGA